MHEAVSRFQALFRGRENVHGQYLDGEHRRVKTLKTPAPDEAWQKHLEGEGPYLGIVPINLANQCYFGAIDIDDDGIDHAALARKIADQKLPLVVCRSKSGGAHLYLFLRDPAPAKLVRDKLKQWAKALGYVENHDGRPIEVFPKQIRLTPSSPGNWINLPYYGGDETNRLAITEDGAHLTLEEFLDLAEALAVPSMELGAISPAMVDGESFVDGPPCLQVLHQIGYPAGTRNQGLYNVGVYYKQAQPDTWQQAVDEYNREHMDPPLGVQEVAGIIRSLERRDYAYMCEQLPINAHCDRGTCQKRQFGIGGYRKKAIDEAFPEVTDLVKILTDPPRWQVKVNGVTVELSTDDLMSIARFRRTVLESLSIIVPMMKGYEWDEKVRDLLEDHKVIEAPEDAGIRGQFRQLVSDFLLLRLRADTREDLLRGLPYEEDGRVLFRSQDLAAFLERRKFKDYSLPRVFTALRGMGAGHTQFNIRGACVQAWWLPVPEGEQSEEFTPPIPTNPEF